MNISSIYFYLSQIFERFADFLVLLYRHVVTVIAFKLPHINVLQDLSKKAIQF
jgi:hypothetical protein